MTLSGKKILITGGSAGIGFAIAQKARERGAQVFLNGRSQDRLDQACQKLGAEGFAADMAQEEQAGELVERAVAHLGGLDAVVNNAAWGRRMSIEEFDCEIFEEMWKSNVVGPAVVTREAIPHLKDRGGDIVNIASTAALRGYETGSAYVATKFALRGMGQCWQAELRKHNIRVITINPSEVQTGFGGRDPERELNPHKLVAEDIADVTVASLEMHSRGYIPEVTVYATNPWQS